MSAARTQKIGIKKERSAIWFTFKKLWAHVRLVWWVLKRGKNCMYITKNSCILKNSNEIGRCNNCHQQKRHTDTRTGHCLFHNKSTMKIGSSDMLILSFYHSMRLLKLRTIKIGDTSSSGLFWMMQKSLIFLRNNNHPKVSERIRREMAAKIQSK